MNDIYVYYIDGVYVLSNASPASMEAYHTLYSMQREVRVVGRWRYKKMKTLSAEEQKMKTSLMSWGHSAEVAEKYAKNHFQERGGRYGLY